MKTLVEFTRTNSKLRHRNQTSFKKGQKFLMNGKPMGRQKGCVPWNKGIQQWPNGLSQLTKQKISQAKKDKPNYWRWSFVKYVCKVCNKVFVICPYKYSKGLGKCCSASCASKSKTFEQIKLSAQKATQTNKLQGNYEKIRLRMKNGGAVYAMKHAKKPSKWQLEVYELIKQKHPDAVSEYEIVTTDGIKSVDIFIPSKNLVIECDGDFWHTYYDNKDEYRQKLIEEQGYRVRRFKESEWKKNKIFSPLGGDL